MNRSQKFSRDERILFWHCVAFVSIAVLFGIADIWPITWAAFGVVLVLIWLTRRVMREWQAVEGLIAFNRSERNGT